jgi:hypothetical protein
MVANWRGLMSDDNLIANFKRVFQQGATYLAIYSRRQDVGIQNCERGVELGYLNHSERVIDDQETHWVYHWTDKAKREFQTALGDTKNSNHTIWKGAD